MREISPAENANVEEYYRQQPAAVKEIVNKIRYEKKNIERPKPSTQLIDKSSILSSSTRSHILDRVADLVDENLTGRSDMCRQFAELLILCLREHAFDARLIAGTATYYSKDKKLFEWDHYWVRIGEEVIDGNVDLLEENPFVPIGVLACPYWGPIRETPKDRRLREKLRPTDPFDNDVMTIWWPELKVEVSAILKS